MKRIIDTDERTRIEVEDMAGKVNLSIYQRMDNHEWVLSGGAFLTKDKAASVGISLIDKAEKGTEILRAKFQQRD